MIRFHFQQNPDFRPLVQQGSAAIAQGKPGPESIGQIETTGQGQWDIHCPGSFVDSGGQRSQSLSLTRPAILNTNRIVRAEDDCSC